ncbi:MAG: Ig-like domain-containing protein, partial [bacterium]|nr:Ig-like domain-containing protein [bacterium]
MNHRASPTKASIRQANIWRGFLLALVLLAAGCTLPTSGGEESIQVSGAPVVSIASPQANATFLEGVQVFVQAAVSNAGSDISRVEVSIDNTIVETLENPNPDGAAVFSITHTWEAAEAGSHTIAVTAFRSSSNESGTQNVTINVIDQASRATATPTATPEEEAEEPSDEGGSNSGGSNSGGSNNGGSSQRQPTNTPEPTTAPEPTEPPATETPSVPIAVVTQTGTSGGINVRGGPGTVYPVVGTLAVNATAEIVGRNTDPNQPWYKIRFNNASQAWILASLVQVQGDVSGLPSEAGPPPPPPPHPPARTPSPATRVTAPGPARRKQVV